MIGKIHAYLVREINLMESEGEKSTEFADRICLTTLEAFWTENAERKVLRGRIACWKG